MLYSELEKGQTRGGKLLKCVIMLYSRRRRILLFHVEGAAVSLRAASCYFYYFLLFALLSFCRRVLLGPADSGQAVSTVFWRRFFAY
jgi:hypothetical protein